MSQTLLQPFSKLLATLLMLLGPGFTLAHATLVIGTLSTLPEAPKVGEPFKLQLTLTDPVGNPTEDALVFAEFTALGDEEAIVFELSEAEAGRYEADVRLASAGTYDLLMRDQTFRQEEVTANVLVSIGDGQVFPADNTFIFPPTSTAPDNRGLGRWLIWVIALPVLAGFVTTAIVLRGSSRTDAEDL